MSLSVTYFLDTHYLYIDRESTQNRLEIDV